MIKHNNKNENNRIFLSGFGNTNLYIPTNKSKETSKSKLTFYLILLESMLISDTNIAGKNT
jgi:hypothetical protein